MRKAQIWSIDYILGFALFSIVLIIAVSMIINILPDEKYEYLKNNAQNIADILVSPGYPDDWNESFVIIPGIADSNRINDTKLDEFDKINYSITKNLLRTRNDYVFFFKNKTSIINYSKCTRGYNITTNASCYPDLETINIKDLVKYERIIILNKTIVNMEIWVWD